MIPCDSTLLDMEIDPQLQDNGGVDACKAKMKSNLRLFPPPLFSRQTLPLNYKYVNLRLYNHTLTCSFPAIRQIRHLSRRP
jgi:hypothetical protein